MCFFKMPKMSQPQVAPQLPSIRETTAPEPESPLFGGGADALASKGEMAAGKKGVQGLKIPQIEAPASLSTATGVSRSGFNIYR